VVLLINELVNLTDANRSAAYPVVAAGARAGGQLKQAQAWGHPSDRGELHRGSSDRGLA
jgi:hypothetical protein